MAQWFRLHPTAQGSSQSQARRLYFSIYFVEFETGIVAGMSNAGLVHILKR